MKGVFVDALQDKLALVKETRDEKLSRLSDEICHQVKDRVPMVDEAWAFKRKIGSRCMNYEEFDAYSTPSRDGKIKKAIKYLLYTATGDDHGDVRSVAKYLNQACGSIRYLKGRKITAAKFSERLMEAACRLIPINLLLPVGVMRMLKTLGVSSFIEFLLLMNWGAGMLLEGL